MSSAHFAIAVFVAFAACSTAPESKRPPSPPSPARITLADQDTRGISGLARDESGALWGVGECDHVLLEFSASDGSTLSRRRIDGVAAETELESLAWLGGSRLAVGTERDEGGRAFDLIYIVAVDTAGARVVDQIELRYDLWSIEAAGNEGIEGLCHAGTTLVAALETVSERAGQRTAAIGRYDLSTREWTAARLRLTTGSGKLSALDCRARSDQLDVLAIERHFDDARILRFSLPAAGKIADIDPIVVVDLAPSKRDTDNYEGIVWLDDRTAALILDNEYGWISGPNTLLRVPLDGSSAASP